jgi:hypothetical protein
MALVADHEVVPTITVDGTDHALDVCILPGRAGRRDDFRDAHRFEPIAEVRAVRRIAVAQRVARPYSVEPDLEYAVDRKQAESTRPPATKNVQLVTEGEVL